MNSQMMQKSTLINWHIPKLFAFSTFFDFISFVQHQYCNFYIMNRHRYLFAVSKICILYTNEATLLRLSTAILRFSVSKRSTEIHSRYISIKLTHQNETFNIQHIKVTRSDEVNCTKICLFLQVAGKSAQDYLQFYF